MRLPLLRRTLMGCAAGALLVTQAAAAHAVPVSMTSRAPVQETGGGWDEVVCAACVGAGTLVLLSGASALTLLLANPSLTVGATQVCLSACMRALEDER
jgi:hypothetical protein